MHKNEHFSNKFLLYFKSYKLNICLFYILIGLEIIKQSESTIAFTDNSNICKEYPNLK